MFKEETIQDLPVSGLQPYAHHASTGCGQIKRIKDLVANARSELKANKNSRPSTEYSVHDIAFTFTNYLPSWIFPDNLWKEEPVSRRRHIARVLRSSPLIARPRYTVIRDKVADWTRVSRDILSSQYITSTTADLDSLLESINDFVATATDVELMDPLFLSAGYITLDSAIHDFISGNREKFSNAIHAVNTEFNHVATLSGDLRAPLESLRHDTIEQTKEIREEMFASGIEGRLRHFGHHIRSELQSLLQEVRQVEQNNQPEASKALRKHTADSLRTEIERLNDIKVTLGKSQSMIDHVWENATNELVQSPAKLNYWVDVAAELKDAIIELGRVIAATKKDFGKKQHLSYHDQHHHTCTCGWNK